MQVLQRQLMKPKHKFSFLRGPRQFMQPFCSFDCKLHRRMQKHGHYVTKISSMDMGVVKQSDNILPS
jgi:hypothetical protein